MSGAPKAVAPASETKDVTPHALSTSWLPRSVTTRPPAAAACILRLRSSARHSASCGPRSSTSPHCTSTASPPVQLAVASTKPAVRSTLTKASQSPWRSPTATVRDGAGRRILSTALGSAAGLRVERSSAGRAAEKARRGTSMRNRFLFSQICEKHLTARLLYLSLKCRRGAGGSSSPFRHRSAVLRPMAAAPMAQLAKPGRLHVQAGRGGHCWVIVSRLNTVFWPTAEDPLEDLLPGTNIRALNG